MQSLSEIQPPENHCGGSLSLAGVEWGLAVAAIPVIAVGTHSPIGLAHWILVAHYLAIAYGCHLLRTIRLFPDTLSQRRNGSLLLIAGSLACSAAPDAYTLVAARLPQAFGIAFLLAAQPGETGMSRLPVGPLIIGLLAGSLAASLLGWRTVFLVTALIGFFAAMRRWSGEGRADGLPEALTIHKPLPKRHPMLLASGLACIIVPVNSYCDFRTFGLTEAILLFVGIGLFSTYAGEAVRNLIARRSSLLGLWIGAIVAGLCLLPAIFHVPDFSAAIPALGIAACGLTLRLARSLPPALGRFAPPAGFLLLASVLWVAHSQVAMESLPALVAMAAMAGAALGLAWTGCELRPVPLFSGLAAGVYAASYFLEFIPASFGSLPSPDARNFFREESHVLLVGACVAALGLAWSMARATKPQVSRREKSGAGKGI